MFYDETVAIEKCEEEPSLIFQLLKEDCVSTIDKILSKKNFDLNVVDEQGNSILMRLLRKGCYKVVLKHMKNSKWDINHQNNDGDTFAHILVSINYVNVMEIIKQLKSNKSFLPNSKNNDGETILDKSVNDNYIYTTVKILEDKRFNNIDLFSFSRLYKTYIKTSKYGKYTKLNNLEVIIESLGAKLLMPKMSLLVNNLKANFATIKEEVINDKMDFLDYIINKTLIE